MMVNITKQLREKMASCEHKELNSISGSLAEVCKECGQVFVDGRPWKYKSGHILEWVNDLVKAKRKN